MNQSTQGLLLRAMPVLFVLLWSTGFIGAKYGLPYAEPWTFLAIRFVASVAVLLVIVRLVGAAWPRDLRLWGHVAVTGVLVHAIYLGGVFYSIYRGMPAGVAALIVGLQPLVTALLARPWLGERIAAVQWLGIGLGLIGIVLVLGDKIDTSADALFAGFGPEAILLALVALLAISVGTIYQKRHCSGIDLLTGTCIQFVAAAAVTTVAAFLFETREVQWVPQFVFALTWLVLGLSVAAILLLMAMIRRGEASRVASLFYLVPPVTAVEAWILFGERLGLVAIVGIGLAVLGVALAARYRA
ncbi:drug/metabolite transporter (DMT)-like permease [Natronocella acetinitrilica]|uniref:Drug/metabolite transporter (DMT)-like permease n=1 Tax=Natronocella acetinitrilica TaxID=414046 RepID=A0AAE3G533_9GAMM|nr:drug/metabolite transporter (DMT)-like permease [Natronocella acetinitrilica]